MQRLFTFVLLFLFFIAALAQPRQIPFVEYDLPNGLHVILHEDHSTPIVAVSILYHVGSKNEDSERTGFAHFFEHLMFEGSDHIGTGEYAKYVQGAGGEVNAFTSFDQTYYYEILPSNQLALGLWLESERMRTLRINETSVETQRKVVKEERKQRYENEPYGSFLEEMFKRAYTVHPYRWIPIGNAQYIDKASVSEFVEFYKTFYVPNNATLSIAGDIQISEAKKLIADYFSDIPKGSQPISRPDITEPPQTAEIRDVIYDNIQLPGVFHAYHIPAQGTDDYYALDMLTTLLASGQSSRLYKKLVDEEQKAIQATAVPFAFENPGLFLILAIANVGVPLDEIELLLEGEFEKVRNTRIDEHEFQKLRNQVENRFILNNSRVAGIAQSLAEYYLFYGNTDLINSELNRYMKVTRDDIQRVAQTYLKPGNRVVLHYLPKSEAGTP